MATTKNINPKTDVVIADTIKFYRERGIDSESAKETIRDSARYFNLFIDAFDLFDIRSEVYIVMYDYLTDLTNKNSKKNAGDMYVEVFSLMENAIKLNPNKNNLEIFRELAKRLNQNKSNNLGC